MIGLPSQALSRVGIGEVQVSAFGRVTEALAMANQHQQRRPVAALCGGVQVFRGFDPGS